MKQKKTPLYLKYNEFPGKMVDQSKPLNKMLLKQTISFQIFKGCLPQILHGPLMNTLSQMEFHGFSDGSLQGHGVYFIFT